MIEVLRRLLQSPPDAKYGSHPLTILGTTTAFWALFTFIQFSGCLLPRRRRLKPEEELEWNIRTTSTVHAVVLVAGSILCFLEAGTYSREGLFFGYSFYPDFFARIFLGYIIYDFSNLSIFFKTLRDYSGMIHHAIFLVVTSYVLAFSIFKHLFAFLAFGELSTPFVNLRWRLAVLGMKESSLYVANGMLMAVTFFIARVVVNGIGLLHLFRIRDVWMQSSVPFGHKLCIALFTLGYLLNLYWFTQIARGVHRALCRPEKQAQR